jgi:ribonuclease-3
MKDLQAVLGHRFSDASLLEEALTHPSCGLPRKDYQRLEFLGDAVLALTASDILYRREPALSEGEMTLVRKEAIREETLDAVFTALELEGHVRIGKGEERSGLRGRRSVRADVLEALIGAIYLDGGYGAAERFVRSHFGATLGSAPDGAGMTDAKSSLQQRIQAKGRRQPEYRIVSETGPDHDKRFECEVRVEGIPLGRGTGRTKQEAEQNAAKQALEHPAATL